MLKPGIISKVRLCNLRLNPRKFRSRQPKPVKERTAWNKLLPQERQAIIDAATSATVGKPVSHIFVHGHDTGKFRLSAVYSTLKSVNLVKPVNRARKTALCRHT